MLRPVKGLLKLALFAAITLLFGIVGCSLWVTGSTAHRVFSDTAAVPYREVGVVLGTSKKIAPDQENLHFRHRMEAAAKLYDAGKIDLVLVSGYDSGYDPEDESKKGYYNEPRDMKKALLELGIPGDRIRLDPAGWRTFDSVVRARNVWKIESFTVISDGFHVSRAVFIADQKGIADVVGFAAQPVELNKSFRSRAREWLARVNAVLDVKVLGTKPEIPGDGSETPIVVERRELGGVVDTGGGEAEGREPTAPTALAPVREPKDGGS